MEYDVPRALDVPDRLGVPFFTTVQFFVALAGVGLAVLSQGPIADGMGAYFPGYHVARSTIVAGLVITLVLGLVVGLIPAWRARTLPCVRALRTTE